MSIAQLITDKEVIVCAGSGGVGKTTTATAMALAAARSGRRVLALTVDPSKRLAETMGVERNATEPVPVPKDRLAAIDAADATLDAWMLDPRVIADDFIHRFSKSTDEAERLITNRIYQQMSRMIAGMQEYMAMEALHNFRRQGRYDLIVLDTPPSRHALDFLYGPGRVAAFTSSRIMNLFLPGEKTGVLRRAATRIIREVNSAVFGRENYEELEEFFLAFSGILSSMSESALLGLDTLKDPESVAFCLVTTPASESLTDAYFFRRKTAELGLPFRAFVLNQSHAVDLGLRYPDRDLLSADPTATEERALKKLQELAQLEMVEVERDRGLLAQLEEHAGDGATAVALPKLALGADALDALAELGDHLMDLR